MPEVEALAASRHGEIIAMMLWVRSGDICYAHLEGSSSAAYQTHAIYGMFAAATEYYTACRILHLGGSAGLNDNAKDGLSFFKRGFANRQVTAYFCGSCLDPHRYADLTRDRPISAFFPAYRSYA